MQCLGFPLNPLLWLNVPVASDAVFGVPVESVAVPVESVAVPVKSVAVPDIPVETEVGSVVGSVSVTISWYLICWHILKTIIYQAYFKLKRQHDHKIVHI